jgi:hypothetical protein
MSARASLVFSLFSSLLFFATHRNGRGLHLERPLKGPLGRVLDEAF